MKDQRVFSRDILDRIARLERYTAAYLRELGLDG